MKSVPETFLSRRTVVRVGITALSVAAFLTLIQQRQSRVSQIITPGATLVVEVADTPAARSAGLSNRDELRGIDGLLLKWDESGRHPVWMAGMRFPLDLVWIDAGGRVLAVMTNVPPCSGHQCSLYEPHGSERSVAVLELAGSTAAGRGLAVGAVVRFPTLSQVAR